MRYLTTVDSQPYEIEIKSEREVIVNGERVEVDFQSVADEPVYSLIVDGRSHEAYVYPEQNGLSVLMVGRLYQVTVEDERQRRLREATGGLTVPTGDFHLKAPMPGLVVAAPVEVGQSVERGSILVILESMKMQNELKSPREGFVQRVRIHPGDRVEQNQVLVTVM